MARYGTFEWELSLTGSSIWHLVHRWWSWMVTQYCLVGRRMSLGVGLGHLQPCPAPFPVCSLCLVFAVGCDFLPFSLQTVGEMNKTRDIRQKFKLSFKEYLTPTYEYTPSRGITYALYIHNMVRTKRTPPQLVTNLDSLPNWNRCEVLALGS